MYRTTEKIVKCFIKRRSTQYTAFILRQIAKKILKHNGEAYMFFIDLEGF